MNIEERLVFHEGIKLMPYLCPSKKTTIGIGHNIEARPFTAEEQRAIGDWVKGITKNAAYMILRNDIRICLRDLQKLGFWYYLDGERQYALIDMCFQLGWEGLCQFKKMLEAIRVKNYAEAYKQCLDSQYAKQTPTRAKRIAYLLKTGEWITDKQKLKELTS